MRCLVVWASKTLSELSHHVKESFDDMLFVKSTSLFLENEIDWDIYESRKYSSRTIERSIFRCSSRLRSNTNVARWERLVTEANYESRNSRVHLVWKFSIHRICHETHCDQRSRIWSCVKTRELTNELQLVKSILFFAQNDDFFITIYFSMKRDVRLTQSERDEQWKIMTNAADLARLSCIHLNEDSSVTWLIEIDQDFKDEFTRLTNRVRANDDDMQDIFAVHHKSSSLTIV